VVFLLPLSVIAFDDFFDGAGIENRNNEIMLA